MRKIYMCLGNYYGCVEAYENNGRFYMSLGNWSGDRENEISEEFYRAIEKEFGVDAE